MNDTNDHHRKAKFVKPAPGTRCEGYGIFIALCDNEAEYYMHQVRRPLCRPCYLDYLLACDEAVRAQNDRK